MKSGKYVKLSKIDNITLSYGSVNSKQLKSVYLRMQCWVEPKTEDASNWDAIISLIRREVRMCTYHNINPEFFTDKYIVDLDLRSSGILKDKRSFLSCEVTLFTNKQRDIKNEEFSHQMQRMAQKIIRSSPTLFREFEIFERKR
jgi:hypothetical protein